MISSLFSLPMAPAIAAEPAVDARLRQQESAPAGAFIAGPENALVRVLAAAVSQKDSPYNPIVIEGPLGVGKSSLAHALAAQRRTLFRLSRVVATTGPELMRGLAHATETASTGEFRLRHHRCDLLLIDDLHRLTGKSAAQQFLLTTIDTLVRRGVLVIATLRQPPQLIAGLSPALVSRLAGGLVVNLAPPGPLACRAVVRQAAASAGLQLDDEQIAALVQRADELPFRLMMPARLRQAVLRLAAVKELGLSGETAALPAADQASQTRSVCRQVAVEVARHFDLTLAELRGKSRRQAIVEARSLAIYIARRLTGASYAELGRHFGDRDHTTVLHAYRKVARAVAADETTRRIATDLTLQLATEGIP